MATTNAEARQQILDALGEATDELASALALLGAAYERLDEHTGDELETLLFRPVQIAYGRGQRTHSQFAARYDLPGRKFEPAPQVAPHRDARELIDAAVESAGKADSTLATLQDSMLPVEFGDPDLRAGLQGVREQLGELNVRARGLVRTVGR